MTFRNSCRGGPERFKVCRTLAGSGLSQVDRTDYYCAFQVKSAARRVHMPCYSYERGAATSLHNNVAGG